jgi:hypothetical protein
MLNKFPLRITLLLAGRSSEKEIRKISNYGPPPRNQSGALFYILITFRIGRPHFAHAFELGETELSIQNQEAFHRLVSKNGNVVCLLARNKYAQRVAEAVPVQAFIDEAVLFFYL